jgi:hypothetical protein
MSEQLQSFTDPERPMTRRASAGVRHDALLNNIIGGIASLEEVVHLPNI